MKKLKNRVIVALFTVVFVFSSTSTTAFAEQFLIGVYVPPPTGLINSTQYDYLSQAKVNWIYSGLGYSTAEMQTMLSLSDARNMRVAAGDSDFFDLGNAMDSHIDTLANRYKGYAATGGYVGRDEPNASMLRGYAHAYNRLLADDPDRSPYMNLLPTYSSDDQLGIGLNQSVAQQYTSEGYYVSSTNPLGQTFKTTASTTFIDTIELYVDYNTWSSEALTLTLWDSPSKTNRLASSQLLATNNGYFPRFELHTSVSSNTTYYWELTHNGGGNNSIGWVPSSSTDVYADGTAYQNGSAITNKDFYFVVYNGTKYTPAAAFQAYGGQNVTLNSSTPRGQSFYNPSWSSFISSIDVNLDSASWAAGEVLTLKLWDSPAKTSQIASGSLSATNNGNFPKFTLNANVTPNTNYYWELTHNGGGDNNIAGLNASTGGDKYSAGSAYAAGVLQSYDFYFDAYSTDVALTHSSEFGQKDTTRSGIVVKGGVGSIAVGQTITTPSIVTRRLNYVELALDQTQWGAGEEATLKVYDGISKNQILGQATLTQTNNGNYPRFYVNAKLQPNTAYYLELTHNGGGDGTMQLYGSTSNAYSGGAAYANGTTQSYDLYFRNVFTQKYQDYLDAVINEVGESNLKYLSVDNYTFRAAAGSLSTDYFLNMEYMRDAAVSKKIPMQYYLQSVGIPGSLRRPTPDEIRYNAYTSLAYGMKSLQYYIWSFSPGHTDPIIKSDGTKSDLYTPVQTLNTELTALGPTLMGLTSFGVYHVGDMPIGTSSIPNNFFWIPAGTGNNIIISYFMDNEGRKYIMAVNKDLSTTKTLTFNVNPKADSVYEVSKSTGQEVSTNYNSSTGVISASFLPGEGKLYALNYSYDFAASAKAWEFSTSGDAEGWVAENNISGARVNFGSYNGTVTGTDPFIASSSPLNVNISNNKTVKIKLKNGTSSTIGQLFFITNADTTWNDAKHINFSIIPNDRNEREYVVDMSSVAGWTGTLKQLRFDPEDGAGSGSFSLDYIRVTNTPAKIWRFSVDNEGWIPNDQISNVTIDGRYNGTITGTDPYITCVNYLDLDIGNNKKIKITLKNNTSSTIGQIYFTTDADTAWNEDKHINFTLNANDPNYTTYTVDMSAVAGWTGRLKQLRIDPEQGAGSGSFSLDTIIIQN
ncbi:hypothetical protein [Cohnella silvisoli]|uniref:Uncharacterized protein n=1 Tax=Cohnella silvisoli TaxID=2873699 RepID=A0ABV1L2E2_9BACL|nr:hypothetical protein [Cohnella silvisoli]MCD9021614.1 hypothetical protein [Cohnella silvisoli]